MTTSAYTKVSKLLGWEGAPVPIPTTKEVRELATRAPLELDAFYELMKVVRFAASPKNEAERDTLKLVVRTVADLTPAWKRKEL